MGTTSSRQQTYDQYYHTLQQQPPGLSQDLNVDPYEILGVSKTFTWDELISAYRRMARMVHPDKGTEDEQEVRTKMFKIATECFRDLAHIYKSRQEGRSHSDLKRDANAFYESHPTRHVAVSHESADTFIDKFNRTFQENKLEDDENEIGYGGMMTKSSKVREDISIPVVLDKYTNDAFNSTFDKVTLTDKKEVIVYKEPEALPMGKNMAYTELGGSRPDDFSSSREGTRSALEFTDYMKAHTTTRLVDPRSVKERKMYKNIDAYEADRARTMAQPATQEELAWRASRDRLLSQAETERMNRLKQRDTAASQHHDKMNRLMLR